MLVNELGILAGILLAAVCLGMRGVIRWGTLITIFAGLALWVRRTTARERISPYSLGTVSEQWFLDHQREL
jgi:hypothetical protein